ncbi:LuxR C-terminal-related transcriptional regulator [Azospirillum doebereinerae]|uniref:LuxR C-terminal-related transcriptional regulator n=1 Tax=Azospirillum doebereinerae TaxID=92933 RepID=UPI001EE4F5DC|nr:response regulator transcription factor [Azospirillum doebereinerae]MCG5238822.1 response regulator transcription factor [Azospirillum doebereinerae]
MALIDGNNLFRQGLKALFADQSFQIVIESSSVKDALLAVPNNNPLQLILIDPSGMGAPAEAIRAFKDRCPEARLVLLTETLDGEALTNAIDAGADGFLMKDISRDVLLQSLRLVMMGEKVFPSHLAALIISGRLYGKEDQMPAFRKGVSKREGQILRCLLVGDSNKLIARHLSITEATVKVHLKSLLRKIDATNRTQAAIWGLNNGFAEVDGGALVDRVA